MSRDVLILGCGYVGSAVARKWLSEGREVWGVSRNTETLSQLEESGFHPVVARVDSSDWHSRVPEAPAVVLNCVSSAGGGIEGYRQSYVGGNKSLVEWAGRNNPGRIVYTGSTAVYPFSDGREVREEDAGGVDLAENGKVVLESEKILLENEALAKRTTVLRLSGIYGPKRHYLLDQLREGIRTFPGKGDYFLNLIYLKDIVSAVEAVAACREAGGKAYNVSDGNPPLKQEVAEWLADRLGMPEPTFDPTASGGRRMRINRGGSSPNRRVCIDRIRSEVGWEPSFPSFRNGYEDMGI